MYKVQRGVTLIELMVVVAIVSILASIAFPAYRNYMTRTYRTEAKSALLQLQATEEKYYLQNNTYAGSLSALGLPQYSENGKYQISISPPNDAQSYTAYARPVVGAGQDKDKQCTEFSVTGTGTRSSLPSATSVCWR